MSQPSRPDDRSVRPLISIVTPSYNQGAFLERTIRSVLEQGYPRLEYFVFDGGSSDDSVEIIRRYQSRLTYWTSAKDDGQASVVNAGWRRATGEILGWLNSDDYYLPGTLAYVADHFEAHPEVMMLYGTSELVDDGGRPVGRFGAPFDMNRALRGDYMIPQPSVFIRRKAIERVGLLDESLYYALDLDLFLRLARVEPPAFVDRALSACTIHPDAKMSVGRAAARQERFRVSARYASGMTRLLIPVLAFRSRVFHALPRSWKRRIDRARGVGAADA